MTITAEEFRERYIDQPAKGNKYHAQRTEVDGVTHDSGHEGMRASQLRYMVRGGEITTFAHHPVFKIGPTEIVYKADFLVVDKTGEIWIEDVKGCRTKDFVKTENLWKQFGLYPLHVLHRNKKAWDIKILGPATEPRLVLYEAELRRLQEFVCEEDQEIIEELLKT